MPAALPDATVVHCVPVADGGEGTVAAAVASGYEAVTVTRQRSDRRAGRGDLRRPTADEAVIEMAAASGLLVLPGAPR